MSQYDEDIYENPFFNTLEKEHKALFEKATANRLVICIPKFSAVKKDELVRQDFEDHILTASSDNSGAFTTVSGHKVEIQQGWINLGSGLKAKKVQILFEETFYNVKDESYRVVCVSGFFNREVEQGRNEEEQGEADFSKLPASYDECIKILWGQQGSAKTKENLDRMLKIFCGEYQRFEGTAESIPNLADLVSSHVTRAMQVVLKDQNIKKLVKQHDMYMASLKVAAETYMMNAVHKHLFSTITACVKSSDALVNKMTRNLLDVRLQHLDVRTEFEENLPYAKKELSRLNQFSTPLGRLFCLKRVITALTKPLFKSQENEGLVMTSDDLLPLLIYLIIKSQIPNWTANLMYMKYFQMAKTGESDEFSFYLATTEAALDFICSGNVKQTKSVGQSKETGIARQQSGGTTSSKEKFFQVIILTPIEEIWNKCSNIYVQYGDESAVRLMLKKHKPTTDDISSKLCHPLCTCDKCSDITATSSQNSGAVSSLARDDMGRTALHIAAFYGQGTLIDVLVKHGCLTDATDYLGCTPLHLAAQKGYQNIILLLVHFGADIGAIDNEGNTPLHLCAKNGHEDCVKAILFLDILKNKLNVNAQNDMGDTPLHMAARWGYDGIVNFLLESEADPRIRNRKRQTPYNVAQNADIRKELQNIMNDPPPTIVRYTMQKPMTLPIHDHVTTTTCSSVTTPTPTSSIHLTPETTINHVQNKSPLGFEVVDVKPSRPAIQLVDNSSSEMMSPTTPAVASLDQTDPKQIEKLFKAIASRDLPLVEYYFGWVDSCSSSEDSPISPPTTPVMSEDIAARLCHPLCQCEKCQHIQKHSSRNTLHVNCQNKKGFAPLHIAVIENNMEVLVLLLKKGAFVNVQTHKHITPLHLACFHDQFEMVEKLVSCGANVNLPDKHGEIPLHLAAAKSSLKTVKYLLQHSSSVNLGNVNGNTSLHHAVCTECIDVICVLLEYGANPDSLNKHSKSPKHLTKNANILELLKKSKELQSKTCTVPKSVSTPEQLQQQQQSPGMRKMMASVDDQYLQSLQKISEGVKSFDRQKYLKRSQTFDHSAPAIDNVSLKLALSIQHFDKEKSLRKAQTFDRSYAVLKPLEHSLSIQHFDYKTLKHVEPVDKSSPQHILSLTRSFSCYRNYADTPTEEHATNIDGANLEHTVNLHSTNLEHSTNIHSANLEHATSIHSANLEHATNIHSSNLEHPTNIHGTSSEYAADIQGANTEPATDIHNASLEHATNIDDANFEVPEETAGDNTHCDSYDVVKVDDIKSSELTSSKSSLQACSDKFDMPTKNTASVESAIEKNNKISESVLEESNSRLLETIQDEAQSQENKTINFENNSNEAEPIETKSETVKADTEELVGINANETVIGVRKGDTKTELASSDDKTEGKVNSINDKDECCDTLVNCDTQSNDSETCRPEPSPDVIQDNNALDINTEDKTESQVEELQ